MTKGSRPAQANSPGDPYLQNNQNKMDWRSGSSRRAPALQVQNTEFKPQLTVCTGQVPPKQPILAGLGWLTLFPIQP
jgi:hypothetical protein